MRERNNTLFGYRRSVSDSSHHEVARLTRFLHGLPEPIRFVLVGTANFVISGVVFIGLAVVIDPRIAYLIAYVAGIGFTTVASSNYVFRGRRLPGGRALFAVWYVVVLLVGEIIVHVVSIVAEMPPWITFFATIAVTAPLNYLGGRVILGRPDQAR